MLALPCLSRRLFSIKSMSLVVLSLQTTTMVLLLRYSRTIHSAPVLLHDAGQERDSLIRPLPEEHPHDQVQMKPEQSTPGEHYVISTAVCLAEMFKLLLSLLFLYAQNGFNTPNMRAELSREVIGNMTETCKMVVPAGLYLLQNNLLFLALTNLDAATYQVTYQLRILCTAAFSWLLLGRRLSITHWLALACLMVGVALVQVDAGSSSRSGGGVNKMDGSNAHFLPQSPPTASLLQVLDGDGLQHQPQAGHDNLPAGAGASVEGEPLAGPQLAAEIPLPFKVADLDLAAEEASLKELLAQASVNNEVSWLLGLLAVFVSCVLSGFSGVYFERLVKRSRQTSLIIRNIQLGLFSLVLGVVTVCSDRRLLWDGGFFQGYTWATWAVIALQACGGLMVSVTMKYADNILKVFATSVSIVLSTLLSTTVLGHSAPTITFMVGTIIVLAASAMYGLAPTSPQQAPAASTAALSQHKAAGQSSSSGGSGSADLYLLHHDAPPDWPAHSSLSLVTPADGADARSEPTSLALLTSSSSSVADTKVLLPIHLV